ncbi:adenosylcobinamide-GDP ribazoletransferase [Moorellaceae bacterium AZ2]
MKAQIRSFLAALRFLTRLPLGGCPESQDFAASVTYFPVVGGVLAGALYILWRGLLAGLPLPAQGGLLLAAGVYLTGGLHLDGFMDTCDGLFSCRERERVLEIMKDSHVGAHGVTSAIVLLLLKYSLLLSLLERFSPAPAGHHAPAGAGLAPALVLMFVLGRWAMALALGAFPYARSRGLGSLFGAGKVRTPLVAASLLTLVIVYLSAGLMGLTIMGAVGLFTLAWGWAVSRRLGGLTGDIYGALAEMTEVLVLLLSIV